MNRYVMMGIYRFLKILKEKEEKGKERKTKEMKEIIG